MAYTVKQVAAMSGVSVRTLHFYHETGLLEPAYVGANGYRFYEEPQLLLLQQILFYRELGFELKRIREILGRDDFEVAAALESHRKVLQRDLARTRRLIETVDRTAKHLKRETKMESEEMFAGFVVAADHDRFGERITLRGEPIACKISGKDTGGAMCAFEYTGLALGPRHLHHEQDEWIYVLDGELEVHVGETQHHVGAGECVFIPRTVAHVWAARGDVPARILNVYQPAGTMEEFFREVGSFNDGPSIHEALGIEGLGRLFAEHGMKLVGPPLHWDE